MEFYSDVIFKQIMVYFILRWGFGFLLNNIN